MFLIGSITKLRSHAFPHDFLELTRTEAIREILSHDLLFTPGSALSYSDDAYKLLAAHPLAVISTNVDVTLSNADQDVAVYRESVLRTKRSAAKLGRLVEELLRGARHQAHRLDKQPRRPRFDSSPGGDGPRTGGRGTRGCRRHRPPGEDDCRPRARLGGAHR